MSESKAPARPSQVTMAGWVAVIGSALLVVTLFDSIAQIRSVEMRDSIDEFLATTPGSGLGLDTAQVQALLRGTMLFAGAVAAAATVLGIYVLQRNRMARLGYTIAAVLVMATAPVTGSPFAVLVAAAAMMLWTRPARDWFAGRAPAPNVAAPTRQEGTAVSSQNPPPGEHEGERPSESASGWQYPAGSSPDRPVPPPTHGFGSPSKGGHAQPGQGGYGQGGFGQGGHGQGGYGQGGYPQGGYEQGGQGWPPAYPQQAQYDQPAQYGQRYGQPQQQGSWPGYAQTDPDKRPSTVTWAAWLTWIFSAVTSLAFVFVALVVLGARDDFVRELEAQPRFQELSGLTTNDIIAGIWVICVVGLIWSVAAFVLAIFAYRRQNWARITLVVSAASAALVSLGAITSVLSVFTMLAAGATVVLLFTGGANPWYSHKVRYPSYSQPYSPYGQPPGGQAYGPQQPGGQQYGGTQQPGPYGGSAASGQYGGHPTRPGEDRPGEEWPGEDRPDRSPHGQGQPESGDKKDPPTNVW